MGYGASGPTTARSIASSTTGAAKGSTRSTWRPTSIDSIAVDPDFLVHVPFSPDGRYLGAATPPGRTPVYDAATGALVQDFRQLAHFERGQLLSETRFHPDDTLLTGGPGLPIRLWDVERGTLLRTTTVDKAFDRE